jgi:hypothetical protein
MVSTVARGLAVLSVLTASVLAAPASQDNSVSDGVTALPFRVKDAEFSTSLNAIVAVRDTPNQLAIYDPETGSSFGVNLPAAPTCVGVSPDGLRAIVGHNGWISEVDLSARTLVQTLAVSANVIDVIHGGNGYAYVFAADSYVRSFNLNTGLQSTTDSWREPAAARLHPGLDRIYGADRYVSPDDVVRFNIVGGPAVYAYDSVYHGDYSFCGDVWISADGFRLFTACGNTFHASPDPALDIRFAGKLSQESRIQWVTHSAAAGSVAVLPGYSQYGSGVRSDNEIHYYVNDSLLYRGKVVLPAFVAEGKTSASRGRWLFFNAAGTKQYIVVQADSSAGIANDYGLVTVDCTEATVSLTPSTVDAAGAGEQVSLTVSGSAGCGWSAHSDVEWLQTTSTGVGNGTLLVNVRANTTSSSRHATITAGGASVTIGQDPAVPGTVEPPPAISSLRFRVTDAEFSKALNAIVAVSEYGLHIYRTDTRSVTTISLDSAAFCVAVSPDGMFAAVGHSGAISYVDLVNVTVLKKLDVSTDVLDVILAGNGYVYAFPRTDQWEYVRCVQISTNTETLHTGNQIYAGSLGRLHPGGSWVYGADNGLSPADIHKFSISSGTAVYSYDSPYHGDYSMCGNLWISENGTRIYTKCGNVFRSTADRSTDMTYAGKLETESKLQWASQSDSFGSIAVLPSAPSTYPTPVPPRTDQEIHYYSPDFLVYQGKMVLPTFQVENHSWQSRGRFHFFSADGVKQHIVVQADPESGMLHDFGVVTVDCSGAEATLSSPSASVGGDGATVQVSVAGKPGCGWRAATATPWLNTLSTGVSDGIVYITVDANRTLVSRTGTVSIGHQTFTIVQAAASIAALNAKSTSPTAVSLTWTFSLSPDHYEVWRDDGTGFSLVGSTQTKSFTDATAPAHSGLVYRVRAVMPDSATSSFAADYAHTFTLTDPSLVGLPIRAVHLEELRAIVDALRAAAGVGAAVYTDRPLPGDVAKLVHVTELRNAINEMRSALGMAPVTFPSLPQYSPIRAATTQELRNAIQ